MLYFSQSAQKATAPGPGQEAEAARQASNSLWWRAEYVDEPGGASGGWCYPPVLRGDLLPVVPRGDSVPAGASRGTLGPGGASGGCS